MLLRMGKEIGDCPQFFYLPKIFFHMGLGAARIGQRDDLLELLAGHLVALVVNEGLLGTCPSPWEWKRPAL